MTDPLQSAYKAGLSTKIALVQVANDVRLAMDKQEGILLVLLDLTSAFDTIDQRLLIRRLWERYGLRGCGIEADGVIPPESQAACEHR